MKTRTVKYIFTLLLIVGFMPAFAQSESNHGARAQEIFFAISEEKDLAKKIQLFHSQETQAFMKEYPLGRASAAYPIADAYILAEDKEHALGWMDLVRPIPILHATLVSKFYTTFQANGDHEYLVGVVSAEMENLYAVLESRTDSAGSAFQQYTGRLPDYLDSKLALEHYDDVYRHLSMIYVYCGSTFLDARNYYQYVETLLALGNTDEAIAMFAKYAASKTDFSPALQQTIDQLMAATPDGKEKFENAVNDAVLLQQTNYRALVESLVEMDGTNLKERLSESDFVLLSFWGSWCVPCMETHPKLIKIYHQYKDHGLEIVGLAQEYGSDVEKLEAAVRKEITEQSLPWLQTMLPTKHEPNHPVNKFIVTGYPTKILVDRTGKVYGRFMGSSITNAEQLDLILEATMGNEEQKARIEKIESATPIYNQFLQAGSLEDQESLYENFTANEDLYVAEVSLFRDGMSQQLALSYAEAGDISSALRFQQEIRDSEIKCSSAAAVVDYMATDEEKIAFLAPYLDDLLVKGMLQVLPQHHYNRYGMLARKYVAALPEQGAEDLIIDCLSNLVGGENAFFVADLHGNNGTEDVDFSNTLTYTYAKALSGKGRHADAANILITYLNADPDYTQLRVRMLRDFDELANLSTLMDQSAPTGHEHYQQLVKRLLLKEDINGKIHGDQIVAGKYFLVDFWGSWCIPCRAGHPHLKDQYEKYKDSGFEIIAVADEGAGKGQLDIKIKNWKWAVEQDGLPWVNLLADDRENSGFDPVSAFQITMFPTKILFDREGKYIDSYHGGDEHKLDAKLEELFGR